MTDNWHIHDLKEIEKRLNCDLADGLTSREAGARLERSDFKRRGGVRSLFIPEKKGTVRCLAAFFVSPPILLLITVSLLTAVFGRVALGLSVLMVALVGATFGGILELRASRRLEAMSSFASPMLRVKRGGAIYHTDGRNVVCGDVILLSVGDILPCDARMIGCEDLTVDEIYYESKYVHRRRVKKNAEASYASDSNIKAPDAKNMLYAGSAIVSGSAYAVVTDVGDDVYLAKYLKCGALAAAEGDAEGVTLLRPAVYKTVFLAASALLLLSLISLLTLRDMDFICTFSMLLSSVSLVSVDLLSVASKDIFASAIKRISSSKSKKSDVTADIRGVKALDRLTGVSSLVVVGGVGLSDGIAHVSAVSTADGVSEELSAEDPTQARILTCLHTYIKALRESGLESDFTADGYLDSLSAYLKESGFDISANTLAIKSLYFAGDGDRGYACAETAFETYRTAVGFNSGNIELCTLIRANGELREMSASDSERAYSFIKSRERKGDRCLTVISENENGVIFEGIVSLCDGHPVSFDDAVNSLGRIGVRVLLVLPDKRVAETVLSREGGLCVADKVITPERLARDGKELADVINYYSVFVGFTQELYCELIEKLKSSGSGVAVYGVDDRYNEIMARGDITISCDPIKYSSERYRYAVYERIAPEGRDTNLRCSQRTRLLSRVIVKRDNERGGGLASIYAAIARARCAYISLTQSLVLFVNLMCSLLSFSAMSVLTGNMLLDPLQAAALAVAFAFLSATAFKGSDSKRAFICEGRVYGGVPITALSMGKIGIFARAALAATVAVTVKILDAVGVFGENATYTLPIYICLMLTVFAEVFLINRKYTVKGEGRRYCWIKVLLAYTFLMSVPALATHQFVAREFYPYGYGMLEFVIVPAYALLYVTMLAVVYLIEGRLNKTS